jgi:tyrosyl-tRNA synthetase
MQCADIFYLKANICQLGMDQRKVNMLAREYCDLCEPKRKFKPIIISHHMIMGLNNEKMSKSNPNYAIFMEDEEKDVNSKMKKAYCKEGDVKNNPPLEYLKHIIFQLKKEFKVSRVQENGGDKIYTSFEEVAKDFEEKKLHPNDLKPAIAKAINEILQPVRDHFKNNKEAKELLNEIKKFKSKKDQLKL